MISRIHSLNTNATLQAIALAQWEFNRTGPYVSPAGGQISWSRLPADSPIIKQHGDPSAGPNTPHLELVPSVRYPSDTTWNRKWHCKIHPCFITKSPISVPSLGLLGGMGIILVTPSSRKSFSHSEISGLNHCFLFFRRLCVNQFNWPVRKADHRFWIPHHRLRCTGTVTVYKAQSKILRSTCLEWLHYRTNFAIAKRDRRRADRVYT